MEVIVVDDGSTDQTHKQLQKLGDSRLKIIRQGHLGVSSARNTGAKSSKGDYIAFCDSDDKWLPQKLSRQVKFTIEGGWAITQTDEVWIRNGVKVNPRVKHLKRAGWIFEPSLELCLISPSCVLISREYWERVGPFDESLPACEDFDMWLRGSLYYPVGLLPQYLVLKYGGHSDQLSRKIIGLDLYRLYSVAKLINQYPLSSEQLEQILNSLEKRSLIYIKGCLKRDKIEMAVSIKDMVERLRQRIKSRDKICL